jgi:hypothetical protein
VLVVAFAVLQTPHIGKLVQHSRDYPQGITFEILKSRFQPHGIYDFRNPHALKLKAGNPSDGCNIPRCDSFAKENYREKDYVDRGRYHSVPYDRSPPEPG